MSTLLASLLARIDTRIVQPLRDVLHWALPYLTWMATRLFLVFVACVAVLILTGVTFGIATAQYLVGYWLLVPAVHLQRPVYFDYTVAAAMGPPVAFSAAAAMASHHRTPAATPDASAPSQSASTASVDRPMATAMTTGQSNITPIAHVNLLGPQWEAAPATSSVYASLPPSLLVAHQPYRLQLDVRLPDSPGNRDIGLVQVQMEILSVTKQQLAYSSRPVSCSICGLVGKMCVVWTLKPGFLFSPCVVFSYVVGGFGCLRCCFCFCGWG
jgi:hypothetical protein